MACKGWHEAIEKAFRNDKLFIRAFQQKAMCEAVKCCEMAVKWQYNNNNNVIMSYNIYFNNQCVWYRKI